jgi:hypothetical protein
MHRQIATALLGVAAAFGPPQSFAQQQAVSADADALAKQLSNPVASLISVPFQFNHDDGYADGGSRTYVNIQPVVPISIS